MLINKNSLPYYEMYFKCTLPNTYLDIIDTLKVNDQAYAHNQDFNTSQGYGFNVYFTLEQHEYSSLLQELNLQDFPFEYKLEIRESNSLITTKELYLTSSESGILIYNLVEASKTAIKPTLEASTNGDANV